MTINYREIADKLAKAHSKAAGDLYLAKLDLDAARAVIGLLAADVRRLETQAQTHELARVARGGDDYVKALMRNMQHEATLADLRAQLMAMRKALDEIEGGHPCEESHRDVARGALNEIDKIGPSRVGPTSSESGGHPPNGEASIGVGSVPGSEPAAVPGEDLTPSPGTAAIDLDEMISSSSVPRRLLGKAGK